MQLLVMLCYLYVCNIKFLLLLISQVTVRKLCMYGWWTGVRTNHRTMLARSRFILVLVVGALLAVLSFSLQYCKWTTMYDFSHVSSVWTYSYSYILWGFPGDCGVCMFSVSGGNITAAGLYLHSCYVLVCVL